MTSLKRSVLALPTCKASEDILKTGLMSASTARVLGLNKPRKYKSLEDAAVTQARVFEVGTRTRRDNAPVSEAIARRDLYRLWTRMVKELGPDGAAIEFFRRTIGIVPCSYPCEAVIDFPTIGNLSIECLFQNNFSADASVQRIQREVLRIANILGIRPASMKGVLRSNCKPSDRKIPATEKTVEERRAQKQTAPTMATLSEGQQVISKICTDVMMQTFTKGALMWHTVGAGKTCAAVAAASVLIAQGWRVMWFSTATGKYAPLFDAFFTRICHFFPGFNEVPGTRQGKQSMIKKYINIWSFSQLSGAFDGKNKYAKDWLSKAKSLYNYTGNDPLYKTLLIFDEPHKIPQIKNANERMSWPVVTRAVRASYTKSGENSCRLLFLDATPMLDNPGDLAVMLNALHPEDKMPNTWRGLVDGDYVNSNGVFTAKGHAALTSLGKGVISYLNLSNDLSRFAYVKKFTFNPVALSKVQRAKMYNGGDACQAKADRERRRECVEKASLSVNMPKVGSKAEMDKRAKDSFPLLDVLVDNIEKQDKEDMREHGRKFKQVIFTNVKDAGAAKEIIKVLKHRGFTEVNPLQNKRSSSDKGVIMLSGSGLSENMQVPGVGAVEKKDVIINTFNNHERNVNGEIARFMLVDGRFREGINLFDVRHFHMLQPLSTLEERQALGRVLRRCGSTFLPDNDEIWQVRAHLYDSHDMARDKSVYEIMDVVRDEDKLTAMDDAERICASIAFDKLVFAQYNAPLPDTDYETNNAIHTDHISACAKYPDDDGKCPARYISGPSETDPTKKCCYTMASKLGKELAKAQKEAQSNQESGGRPKGDQDAQRRPVVGDEDDTVDEDEDEDTGPKRPIVEDYDDEDGIENVREQLEGMEMDNDDDEDTVIVQTRPTVEELDDGEEELMEEGDEEEEDDVFVAPPVATQKRRAKTSCKPPMLPVKLDGTCKPGYKKHEQEDGSECCINACGRKTKPDARNKCPSHMEEFMTADNVKCCQAVKKKSAQGRKTGSKGTTAAAQVIDSCPEGSISRKECPKTKKKVVGVRSNGNKCCADACPGMAKPRGDTCAKKYKSIRVHGQVCCQEK